MPSITPVSEGRTVALKRNTEVKGHFFDSTEKHSLRPIYTTVRTYIRAVDANGYSDSEWEATDNFSIDLTIDEAEVLVESLTKAISQAKAQGF